MVARGREGTNGDWFLFVVMAKFWNQMQVTGTQQ